MDMQHMQNLVKVLLDPTVDIGSRDDAVMDLYETDAPEARQALLTVAGDPQAPDIVLASAGESLGQIATRTGRPLTHQEHAGLTPEARHEYDGATTSVADINAGG
ncbi:hypothetical protein ACFUGD_16125 [Streptomyces sp. NPDC057217]|uniref:hypothetical protein n=1 Tax=Streptomyces sp. NPDC057217 TaxID=3346054 RepID=UPI0036402FE5